MKYIALFLTLIFLPILAFAVDLPAQYDDATLEQLIEQLVYIITNYKVAGTLGTIVMAIILMVNILKSSVFNNVFQKLDPIIKRAAVTVLGVSITLLTLKLQGLGWFESIVTALFTTGGAVAIYEAIKPLVKK